MIQLVPVPYEGKIGPIGLDELAKAFRPYLFPNDILVVTQKAVSYAEGRVVNLNTVTPSIRAQVLSETLEADQINNDPRIIQLILRESIVMKVGTNTLLTRMPNGMVCLNAGIDVFDVGENQVCLLPLNSDASARYLNELLNVPVVISDTQSRFYRAGCVNVAIGSWGLAPLVSYIGHKDAFGNELKRTIIAIADELATVADLVMGKFNGIPAVAVRGYPFLPSNDGSQLLNNSQRYSLLELAGQMNEEEGDADATN